MEKIAWELGVSGLVVVLVELSLVYFGAALSQDLGPSPVWAGIFSHSSAPLFHVVFVQDDGPIEPVRVGQTDDRFGTLHLKLTKGNRSVEAERRSGDRAGGDPDSSMPPRTEAFIEAFANIYQEAASEL